MADAIGKGTIHLQRAPATRFQHTNSAFADRVSHFAGNVARGVFAAAIHDNNFPKSSMPRQSGKTRFNRLSFVQYGYDNCNRRLRRLTGRLIHWRFFV